MTSWPRGSNISALRIQSWLARKSSRRSLMVAPLSSGPPPDTRRTGLPQVWPSRQEKVCTGMVGSGNSLVIADHALALGETERLVHGLAGPVVDLGIRGKLAAALLARPG